MINTKSQKEVSNTIEKLKESAAPSDGSGRLVVYYDEQLPKWVWFITKAKHGLILPKVDPFTMAKEKGFEKSLMAAAFGMPCWPFISDEVGDAVAEFLNSPFVAKLGFCEDAICVAIDQEFPADQIDIFQVIGALATVLDEVEGLEYITFLPNEVLFACDQCNECGIGVDT